MFPAKIISSVIALLFLLSPSAAFSQIEFAPYQAFAAGSSSDAVCIGDLNNDGLNDVALGTGTYFDAANDFKISVFLQNNSGGLNPAVKYNYPQAYPGLTTLKIADLNGDSRNDIILGYNTKIGILYQNSAGTFNAIVEFNTGALVECLDTGDLNDDGMSDVAVSTEYASYFKVFYQIGGSLVAVSYPKPTNAKYIEVEIGDVNADGKDDIIFQKFGVTSGLHVYLQNEITGFDIFTEYIVPNIDNYTTLLDGIGVGDLNHDGLEDVAASRSGNRPQSKIIVWYQNQNTHALDDVSVFPAYDIPNPVEIDDFNNDGENELITVHGGWQKLSCYQQDNNNLLGNYTLYPSPGSSHYDYQALSLGDLNHDGKKDVAVADTWLGLLVYYNTTTLSTADFNEEKTTIYPNPAGDFLTIKSSHSPFDQLKIYDMLGQCVLYVGKANDTQTTINLGALPVGLYTLKVYFGSQMVTQKLLKN
ncbi:T9SS type A sorting domain-containing protein [Flavobacterium sp.]|uniref:T9SS type A sorting domain-containing protein n=1 Tax=Flavobacterium sp. TaxID=239 RepID=UPI00261C14E3|nr:T9SS type A sorting domain-containing protein [Flavobacterium sp.]